MLVMAKKTKKQPEPEPVEESPDNPVSWRPDDPRLKDALMVLAKRHKRSRNMMLTYLVEDACRAAGLWPPAAS